MCQFRISNFGFRILTLVWLLVFYPLSFILYPLNGMAYSLMDVQQEYLQGNYEAAIEKARSLPEAPPTLYFLGLAYTKVQDYPRARYFLRKLAGRFPGSDLYEAGLIKLADTYFLEKDYPNAKKIYQKIIEKRPSLNDKALIYLRLAQIASREGQWSQKRKYLKTIKDNYSRSPEMKYVKVLEGWGDFFTVQVGAFSDKQNAQALCAELKNAYPAYLSEDKSESYPVYKVRVGKYNDRATAEKVSRQLLEEGYPARIYP